MRSSVTEAVHEETARPAGPANLALRVVLELAALAALAAWGVHAGHSVVGKVALGVGALLVAAVACGMFAAPGVTQAVSTTTTIDELAGVGRPRPHATAAIAYVAAWLIGLATAPSAPSPDAADAAIQRFYADNGGAALALGAVLPEVLQPVVRPVTSSHGEPVTATAATTTNANVTLLSTATAFGRPSRRRSPT
jgi:Protein of unknown function (DUF2568)